jgi:hypothetical protein
MRIVRVKEKTSGAPRVTYFSQGKVPEAVYEALLAIEQGEALT